MKKATSKVIFKLLSRSNVFLITFLLSLFLFSPVFAWTEPSQPPPEGNVPPPLNQGIETAPSFQYTWDKIGIGTDLPVNNLHVYGNTEQSIRIQATADSAVLYLQAGNPDTSSPSQIYQAMDQDDLRFWVSGGDKMIIDSLGNVGIGTTSPSEKLDVDGFVKSKNYQVSDQGLVLGMNFNSATISGTAGSEKIRDSSGYNNHGTNYGATYNATGGFNGSGVFSFDGVDDYVDCGNDESLNITDAITIEAWVKPTGAHGGGYGGIWFDQASGAYNRLLVLDNGALLAQCMIGGATVSTITASGLVPLNVFTHVVLTYNGSEIVLWVNDEKQTPVAASGTIALSVKNRMVGRGYATTYYFNGTIDEVRIYNRALSADEIKSHYLQKAEIHNSFVSQKDVYVDSAGNVGIGTTDPGVKLDVSGDANVSGTLSAGAISGSYTGTINASNVTPGYFASNDTPGNYTFTNADKITPILHVDAANNRVGIGTTEPQQKLHIAAGAGLPATSGITQNGIYRIARSDGGYNVIDFGLSGVSPFGGWVQITRSNDLSIEYPLLLNPNGGNVGIGTTGPGAKLHIYDSDYTKSNLRIQTDSGDGTIWNAIELINPASSGWYGSGIHPINIDFSYSSGIPMAAIGAGYDGSTDSTYIDFHSLYQSGYKDDTDVVMRIKGNGNVGIGTTTPKNRLDVEGGAVVGATYSGTNTAPTNGLLVEGNVGIGTTSPGVKLDIDGGTEQVVDVSGGRIRGLNLIPLGDSEAVPKKYLHDNFAPITGGVGSAFVQGGNSFGTTAILGTNDAYNLNIETNGVARMTVDTTGNVGIGTTEPNTKLTISGTPDSATGVIRVISSISTPADSTGGILRFETNTGSNDRAAKIGAVSGVNGYVYFQGIRPGAANDANIVLNPSSGNVGIGTTTPKNRLDVEGGAVIGATYSGTNTAPTNGLLVEGNVGIGTTSPGVKLDIDGGTEQVVDVSGGRIRGLNLIPLGDSEAVPKKYLHDNFAPITGGVGSAFVQGGNSFGTTAILGTNDAYNLNIETNGVARMTVDTTGNVGIGIADPGLNKLNVQGGNVEIGNALTAASGYITGDLTVGTGDLIVGGSDLYVDNVAGKVGIGTTEPKNKLDVEGGAVVGATYSGTNTAPSNGLLVEGNVGIGTTSFAGNQTKMQVSGGDIYLADPVFDDDKDVVTKAYVRDTLIPSGGVQGVGNGQANYIAKWANDNTITKTTTPIFEKDGNKIGIAKDNPAMALDVFGDINSSEQVIAGTKFQVGASEMTSSQLIVNGNTIYTLENGNVGIGTTTPGYKLDVSGTLNGTTLYQNGQTLDERFITGAHPTNLLPNSRFLDYTDATHAYNWVNFSPGKREIVDAIINTQTGLSVDVWDDSGWSTTNEYIWMTDANIDFSDSYLVGKYVVFTGNPTASLKDYKGEIVELDEPNHKVRLRIPEGWNKVIGIPATPTVGEEYNIVAIANRSTKCVKFYANASNYNQTVYSLYFTIPGNEKIAISYDQYIRSLGSKGMYVQYEVTDANGKMVYRWAGPGSTTSNTNNWVVKRFNPIGPFNNPDNWAGAEVGATVTPTFRMRIMFKYYDSTNQGEWYVTGVNVNAGELAYAYTPHYLSEEDSNAKLQGNLTLDGTLNAGATTLAGLTVDTDTLYVDSTNHRVGIGTTTPKNKLDIEGGAVVGATYSGTNTAPTNGLLVEGNVGIGTTSPGAKLHVNGITTIGSGTVPNPASSSILRLPAVGTAGEQRIYIELQGVYGNDVANENGGAFIKFKTSTSANYGPEIGGIRRNGGSGDFLIKTGGSNPQERLRILDNGNVGIGTTSPGVKLDIDGGTEQVVDVSGGRIRGLNLIPLGDSEAVPKKYLHDNFAPITGGVGSAFVQGGNSFGTTAILGTNDAYNLNIETNGVARMTVDTTGNVGIGTTTPKNKLDIEGGAVVGATYSGTNTAPSNGLLVEGNVGIGTTTPNYTLEVNGTIHTKGFYYEDDSAAEGRVLTALNSEGLAYWKSLSEISGVTGSGTSNYIPKWGTDGTTLINTISPIYEDAAGNVGIGIADPGLNKLNVQGGNVEIGNALTAASGYITGDLTVGTGDLIVGGSDLYVDNAAGNVGIGTTSPQTLLDVRGHGVFGNALTPTVSDTENIINILSGMSSNGAINGIAFMENTDGYGMKIGYDGTGSGVANKLAIYNNADAEIITFQNGGNVGIGTTTPKNKLDVEGGAVIGATYSGTNTAPTNGLLVEGNVGIGTTSPGSYKLNVNGRLRYDISKSNEVIGFYTHANKIEILYEGTGSYPVKIKSTNGDFCAGGSYIRWIEADGTNGITSTPFGGDCSTIELASNGDDSVKYLLWDHGDHRFYWGDSPSDDQQIVGEYYYPGRGKFTWMVAMDRNAFPFEDNVEMTHTLTVAGNVGIGTTSPAQKLHVAGNVRVDGAIVAPEGTLRDDGGGWVRTYGNTGWHSQTYGGGWYMTDTTYLRSYNNKPIYVGAGNSYFGGNVGIGTTSPQGALDMNSQKIVRVAVPTVDTDAANKGYVDDAYQPGGVGVIWNCTTKDADGNCLAGANDIYPRDTNWLVGIGNNNPGVALDVTGDVSNSTQITAGTKLKVGASEMTSSQLIVNGNTIYTLENGKVGIGTTEPSTALEVNGAVTATTFYGNLSGYATTAGSADHATYANSALRAQYLGDSFQVMADAQGRVGIGTTSPGDKLDVREGNVNVALNATVGQQLTVGTKVWTGDGSASLPAYSFLADSNSGLYRLANDKIGLITGGSATKGITIDSAGNVGIGTTEPKNRLDIEGGAVVGATYSGTNTAPSNGLLVAGNVGIGTTDIGDNKLKVNGNVQISSGELTVDESVNISNGNLNMNNHDIGPVGKLTVNVIDPIYEIEGEKYATYVSDFAGGLRMETAGIIKIKNQISNRDEKSKIYEYVIDFDDLEKGSDLWLFWQTSNQDIDDLIIILSPGFEGQVWYKKEGHRLAIYSDEPGEVSYRLLAPRQDYKDWPNLVALQKK